MLALAYVKGVDVDYPYDIRSAYLVSIIERERAIKLREFELLGTIAQHAGSIAARDILETAYNGLFPWARTEAVNQDQEDLQNLLDMWENMRDELQAEN